MLPRQYHLPRNDLARPKRPLCVFSRSHVAVKVFFSELSHPRFAVAVPQRIAKRSVARNRIRRTVWRALAEELERIVPGRDIIVSIRALPEKDLQQRLLQELNDALRRCRAYKSESASPARPS